jgi:hypothetical protein
MFSRVFFNKLCKQTKIETIFRYEEKKNSYFSRLKKSYLETDLRGEAVFTDRTDEDAFLGSTLLDGDAQLL